MTTILDSSESTQFPIPLFKPEEESRPYLQIIVYICSNLAGETWRTDLLFLT